MTRKDTKMVTKDKISAELFEQLELEYYGQCRSCHHWGGTRVRPGEVASCYSIHSPFQSTAPSGHCERWSLVRELPEAK